MDIKINTPFKLAELNVSDYEIYNIVFVDIEADKVVIEVKKVINGEEWTTKREWTWLGTAIRFDFNNFEYL